MKPKTIKLDEKRVKFIEKYCQEKNITFTEWVKRMIDGMMEEGK